MLRPWKASVLLSCWAQHEGMRSRQCYVTPERRRSTNCTRSSSCWGHRTRRCGQACRSCPTTRRRSRGGGRATWRRRYPRSAHRVWTCLAACWSTRRSTGGDLGHGPAELKPSGLLCRFVDWDRVCTQCHTFWVAFVRILILLARPCMALAVRYVHICRESNIELPCYCIACTPTHTQDHGQRGPGAPLLRRHPGRHALRAAVRVRRVARPHDAALVGGWR